VSAFGLALLAASAASRATPAHRGFTFDPASTLAWSVPLLLLMPVLTFVVVLSGVRGRRATSNVTIFGLLVTLAAVVLVGWARWRIAAAYEAAFQWINIPVSFTGASQFQGFGIDISFEVDHVALVAAAALLVMTIGVLLWHRAGGRQEGGQARLHALVALAVLAALGVCVSGDLAAIAAWWGLGGLASYLLLAHRWGWEPSARASRWALALPLAGDLALLCGVAVIYSRFGQLTLDKLVRLSVLHGTYGAGLRSLTVACLLFGLAAAVRAGLFPFTGWLVGTQDAPPAAAAWVQAAWPLLAVVLIYRLVPVFDAAGPQAWRALTVACAVGVLFGALLSLSVNSLRASLLWAASAVSGLLLVGIGQPGVGAGAIAGAAAACLARPALVLAGSAVVAAVRSVDLADMGAGWRRMPYSTLGLLLGGVALSLAAAEKDAARLAAGWRGAWFYVAALLVVGVALLRPAAVLGFGELRRRRAFEPGRVREVVALMAWPAAALGALGLVAAAASFLTGWLAFIGADRHSYAPVQTLVLAAAAGLAGPVLAIVVFGVAGAAGRRLAVAPAVRASGVLAGLALLGIVVVDRFGRGAGLRVVGGIEERGLGAGERGLGRGLEELAALPLARSLAAPAVIVVLLALVVVVFGALSGVPR
jgi:NADH:ubiquinone oxidoreductase subunit 5 (subunit L)/multisubunit Na+/H+ antiporter MnhA subunit